jgi:CheY-like chemotaxis protein
MPARVFIVEDDPIIVHLIEQMLTIKGYRIAGSAGSGNEALEKIPVTPCDVILMDIGLAGETDGITVARILSTKTSIPVIFVTGNFDDQILQRARTPNTYGYIIKPFSVNDLVSNIEIAIFTCRSRSPAPPAPGAAVPPVPAPPEPQAKPKTADAGRMQVRYRMMEAGLGKLYDNGLSCQSRGNYSTALQYFIEILEHDPDEVSVWVEKGDVLHHLGRTGEALSALDTALGLDPANEYAVCKKCRVLCSAGRYDEALAAIDGALALLPKNPATLVEKSVVLHELGRNDEALRILDSVIVKNRRFCYAFSAWGRILGRMGKNKEALDTFRWALDIEPKNISLWMDLIRIFEQKQDFHTAINILERAIKTNPDNEVLTAKRDRLLHSMIPLPGQKKEAGLLM